MSERSSKLAWVHALVPVVFISFLAIYPQLSLWIDRGSAWNGTYYVSNYDEPAYSAYVNALVSGKPRKTDPFTGVDDAQSESLYSVQFVPAYAVAAPARMLGVSTATSFIILSLLIAIATSLALFFLIRTVSENDLLASAGTVLVLCLGTAAAYEGELRHWISGLMVVDYFPFLRRYQPGLGFPVFLLFVLAVWKSLSAEKVRDQNLFAVAAGGLLSLLVFTYFYLWTSAAAFLGLATLIQFALIRDKRKQTVIAASIVSVCGLAALVPYFILVGHRAENLDSVQLLDRTHAPDLLSSTVLIGAVIVAAAIFFSRRGNITLKSPVAVLILSTALTPILLLNQQVITGRSLQPIHYEIFVSNYLVLLSAVFLVSALYRCEAFALRRDQFRKAFAYACLLAAGWGVVEASSASNRSLSFAELRDGAAPAIRLADADARSNDRPGVILTPEIAVGDFVQTVSGLRPLWTPHTSSAGGVSVAENKRLFYLYLYYSGFSDRDLAEALRGSVFEITAAVFGSERALPELGGGGKQITRQEIEAEASNYRSFVNGFDAKAAAGPRLDYVVVAAKSESDLSHIDRWYARQLVDEVDGFRLYRLTAKPN